MNEWHVFLNVPYDASYQRKRLPPMAFALIYHGLTPRCALECVDGTPRLSAIVDLIRACDLGVHDLSRTGRSAKFPRHNMPLELGLFLGSMHYHGEGGAGRKKKYLILDESRDRYRAEMSDVQGTDVTVYDGGNSGLIRRIVQWADVVHSVDFQFRPTHVAADYENYLRLMESHGYKIRDMSWAELTNTMARCIAVQKARVGPATEKP